MRNSICRHVHQFGYGMEIKWGERRLNRVRISVLLNTLKGFHLARITVRAGEGRGTGYKCVGLMSMNVRVGKRLLSFPALHNSS